MDSHPSSSSETRKNPEYSFPFEQASTLQITIGWSSILRLVAGMTLLLVIWQSQTILFQAGLLLGLAVLLSTAISGTVTALARRKVPRWLAIFLVYMVAGGILIGVLDLAEPVVSTEFMQLRANFPTYLQVLQNALHHWAPSLTIPSNLAALPWQVIVAELLRSSNLSASGLGSQATGLLNGAVDLFVLLILVYLMSLQKDISTRVVNRWVPIHRQALVLDIMRKIAFQIRRWMAAQLLLGMYFALAFGIGLALLRVPFAFSIAVIGGVLELFPYVGGAIAATLAFLVGLSQSPIKGLATFLLWLIIAEVEAHIVAPALYGRALHISSLIILLALYLGFQFLGILGVFLAVPLVIVISVVLETVFPEPSRHAVSESPVKASEVAKN